MSHAVNLLGISTVKSLAPSFSLVKNIQFEESSEFNHTNFWKDSLIGAVSTKLIAEKVRPEFSEDAFSLGLLQDIGTLTLNNTLPKQYSLVMTEIEKSGRTYHEAESQILGFNHMEIGEYLMKLWGLPDTDTFGHPVGDFVIKTVADSLSSELRESDHVARYGGDEFAVILPETPLDNALSAAEKLREAIESLKVICDNKDIFVTMSSGVSAIPTTHSISKDELKKGQIPRYIKPKNKAATDVVFLN